MNDESIFADAAAIADPVRRQAFLDRECRGNDGLRREIEKLLAAHLVSNPLDQPPQDLANTVLCHESAGEKRSVISEGPGTIIGSCKLMEKIGELDWIVMRCLEKNRTRRYDTAVGLAKDVQRYLDDETVEARPPSSIYRFRKKARRNKIAITTAILVGTALFLGLGVSIWQALRATHAERIAAQQRDIAVEAEEVAKREKSSAIASREELRQTLYATDLNLASTRCVAIHRHVSPTGPSVREFWQFRLPKEQHFSGGLHSPEFLCALSGGFSHWRIAV